MGAREQVQRQLLDKYGQDFDKEAINGLSQLISTMILGAVDKIFERAMGLKQWYHDYHNHLQFILSISLLFPSHIFPSHLSSR